RDDRVDDVRTLGRRDDRGRRSGARAEIADAELAFAESFGDEIGDRQQAFGEQVHVETQPSGPLVLLFLDRRKEIEEERGESAVLQLASDLPVSRAQPAAS